MLLFHKNNQQNNFLSCLFFLAIAVFLLSSCNFRPVYGKIDNQQQAALGIEIEAPSDAAGRQFKQSLEDLLNHGITPQKPLYKLKVTINISYGAMGVARDGSISRYNAFFVSQYILSRISDGKIIKSDVVQHVGSYNNQTGAYYSTYIAQKDAMKRGIVELSELYRQRLNHLLINQ